jgi:hypothetical protein
MKHLPLFRSIGSARLGAGFSVFLLALGVAVGCHGKRLGQEFSPPLVTENETMRMTAREVQVKGDLLRVWLAIENKSDQSFDLQYSDFSVTSGGVELRGALRVPFVRVSKGFDMPAGFYKEMSQPIEFQGWASAPSAEVVLSNIPVSGEMTQLRLVVPIPQ